MSVRELEPSGSGLEFLEEVGERDPYYHIGGRHHLQVDHEVLGGERAEEEVEEGANEVEGLGG